MRIVKPLYCPRYSQAKTYLPAAKRAICLVVKLASPGRTLSRRSTGSCPDVSKNIFFCN